MRPVEIIAYTPTLAHYFTELNLAWVEKYFTAEPMDRLVLGDPETHIIQQGGYIFFASVDGTIAGTFALLRKTAEEFELAKMAVDESYQGKKIGNRMLEFCITKAKELKIRKLILYSNTILAPAIHLYKKYGFIE